MPLMSDWSIVGARFGAAIVAGSIIGLNRNLHHKPAGVRTHALVAMGSALFMVVTTGGGDITAGGGVASRTIQGIVAGIGFLGAGVILHRDAHLNRIQGLTTASAIWLAAGLGVACGVGMYVPVVIATVFALAVLILGGPLEAWAERHFRPAPPPPPGPSE